MRPLVLSLMLIAAATACVPAAPAPLQRRGGSERAAELEAMQQALARVADEAAGRGIRLMDVRRGDAAREWVVTYRNELPAIDAIRLTDLTEQTFELRLTADTAEQFAQMLRDQFAYPIGRKCKCG